MKILKPRAVVPVKGSDHAAGWDLSSIEELCLNLRGV